MSLIEQSLNSAPVLQDYPVLKYKIDIAEYRLKVARYRLEADISLELIKLGISPTTASVQTIIDGFPDETLFRLLSERT